MITRTKDDIRKNKAFVTTKHHLPNGLLPIAISEPTSFTQAQNMLSGNMQWIMSSILSKDVELGC